MTVTCGRCIGCRLSRSHAWAIRCVHEASAHQHNHFITLTYNDENIPKHGTLHHEHFQRFMKRLRWHNDHKTIRFFMCGEYGDKLSRPHYHALIFGHEFNGLQKCSVNKHGDPSFTSPELSELWGMGHCTVGQVNFKTAAYCSRYITKKITGKQAETHYAITDPETGATHHLKPEYCTMSKKPGIGSQWAQQYDSDNYPSDFVVISGRKCSIPSYYDRLKERVDPETLERIKLKRIARAARTKSNTTPERLAVRKEVLLSRLSTSKRPMEAGE